MPDREGGEPDPNTESGFNAILAGLTGKELSSEQRETLEGSDTSVAGGLTETESTQERDDQGRFVPAAPAVVPPAEGAASETAEQKEDPALAALLEQHGGDVDATLAAVLKERDEAQSLIGRQGNEVGDLRTKLAELEGRLNERESQPTALPWVDESTSEAIATMVSESGGRAAMQWVVENRPELIEPTLEAWSLSDDPREVVNAARFAARMETNLATQALTQGNGEADTEDPRLQSLLMERSIASALDKAREGVDETTWNAIRPYLTEEMSKVPEMVQGMIVSPDAKTQADGVRLVVELAKGRVIAEATAQANAERQESSVAAKRAAQVATGSLRPVAERKSEGAAMTTEEKTKAFHEALMATETTSVRDGLVYGKA